MAANTDHTFHTAKGVMGKTVLSTGVVGLADAGFVKAQMLDDFSIEIHVGIAGAPSAINYDVKVTELQEDYLIVLTPKKDA